MALKRLSAKIMEDLAAKKGSKSAAWYELARRGYLPAEIAIFGTKFDSPGDVVTSIRLYCQRKELPFPAVCAPKLIRKEIKLLTDWRVAFRNSSMRTGLALVLSQPMLEYLCAASDNVQWDRSRYYHETGRALPDNFIATANSLVKRGLITPKKIITDGSRYDLTPIGHKLVEILKVSGEFKVADAALEKAQS